MLIFLPIIIPPFSLSPLLFFQMLPIILKNSHSIFMHNNVNVYFELYYNITEVEI